MNTLRKFDSDSFEFPHILSRAAVEYLDNTRGYDKSLTMQELDSAFQLVARFKKNDVVQDRDPRLGSVIVHAKQLIIIRLDDGSHIVSLTNLVNPCNVKPLAIDHKGIACTGRRIGTISAGLDCSFDGIGKRYTGWGKVIAVLNLDSFRV